MPLYDAVRVESDLATGKGDLIAVGRPFLANPDLPARWQANAPLNSADMDTVYSADAKGYSDHPL
jgi:N-ethylmaleimide reductase